MISVAIEMLFNTDAIIDKFEHLSCGWVIELYAISGEKSCYTVE